MSDVRVSTKSAIAAAACATATYIHFLIFAEFALLEIMTEVHGGEPAGKADMFPLVAFGILGAFAAATLLRDNRTKPLLAAGFLVCAIAAGLAAAAHSPEAVWMATALTGAGLGFTTVIIAGSAHRLFAGRRIGLWLGAATGVAYAFCNLPAVFSSAPRTQAMIAGVVVVAAVLAALVVDTSREPAAVQPRSPSGFWSAVAVLFVLVWFDSAAFFLIQHDPELKSVSWGQDLQLWTNAAAHLVAALVAGALVDSGRIRAVLALAGGGIGAAVFALQAARGASTIGHLLYPIAVSLYSVPLIVLPALTRGTRSPSREPMRAAILYSLSGWVASAVGIGTVLEFGDIALVPVFLAGALVVALILRSGPWRAIAVGLILCALPDHGARASEETDPTAEGRRVYIAEGCIHCHSQFVRPDTADVVSWGPAAPLDHLLDASPPLPGNRRQGPDLQNVGVRRSPDWNRLHLVDPRSITPGSRMPSYAYLFEGNDPRGPALVAYLSSLGIADWETRSADIASWLPPEPAADTTRGRALYARFCAQCHGDSGRGDGPVAVRLNSKPRDLTTAGWRMIHPGDDAALARTIKFGIPGTAMAGHESLPDDDIAALTGFVLSLNINRNAR